MMMMEFWVAHRIAFYSFTLRQYFDFMTQLSVSAVYSWAYYVVFYHPSCQTEVRVQVRARKNNNKASSCSSREHKSEMQMANDTAPAASKRRRNALRKLWNGENIFSLGGTVDHWLARATHSAGFDSGCPVCSPHACVRFFEGTSVSSLIPKTCMASKWNALNCP